MLPSIRSVSLAAALTLVACAQPPIEEEFQCSKAPGLNEEQCALVRSLELSAELPPARGNAVADDMDAAILGHRIFYDARFSADGRTPCAKCHQPEQYFMDGVPRSVGVTEGVRNSPTVLNSARLRHLMWDGRVDSVWSQPLLAFESPAEMDFTRVQVAQAVSGFYRIRYERAFGPLPDLTDTDRFPPRARPGEAAWDAMTEEDRGTINGIVANVGKAIEAFLRKLAAGRSPVDEHLAGKQEALSETARRGLTVLVQAGCVQCHSGPMLTDERYHNLGVPTPAGLPPDLGRAGAFEVLAASPFTAEGPYYDGEPPATADPGQEQGPQTVGAFRTPPLRNLRQSPPYMHDGSMKTLEEVVDFHLQGGGRGKSDYPGEVSPLLQPVTLSADDRAALLELLRSLDGAYPGPPWYDWPES